jgi:hypothetical protein
VLKELVKHPDPGVKIYGGMDYDAYRRGRQFIESQPKFKNVKFFRETENISTFFIAKRFDPKVIKETGIICDTIIYDLIPMVSPEHGDSSCFSDIINSLTQGDYIFAISNSPKSDIIMHLPQVDPVKISLMSFAAGTNFCPCSNFERYTQIVHQHHIPKTNTSFRVCVPLSHRKMSSLRLKFLSNLLKKIISMTQDLLLPVPPGVISLKKI